MVERKIINGITEEIPSKCKFGNGRLYPIKRESSNRFPEYRVDRVRYNELGVSEIYGDDEPNGYENMTVEDFSLRSLMLAGVNLEEVYLRGGNPLDDSYKLEQKFNKEMNNPLNFEKDGEN